MRPIHRRTLRKIHAVCAVLRRGECPGGWCEHWVGYTGACRGMNPAEPPVPTGHRCAMVDDQGESMCTRAPDREAGESTHCAQSGERRMDWFMSGYDEWSFRYFPSAAEFHVWTFTLDRGWDRHAWRRKRYWRKVRGKQVQAARTKWRREG